MKILITGGAGFVGSQLAKKLVSDHEITVVDNLSTGFKENIPNGCEFVFGDIGSEEVYHELSEKHFEVIYHIAGQSSGEISFDDPIYDLNTNAKSTLLLLQFARKCKCKNFIYMSSMSVYGDYLDAPVGEEAHTFPLSFYGVGKLASEHYLRIDSNPIMRKTVLRLCNTYGPGQNMSNLRQGMVSIFIKQAVDEGHILSKGDKHRFRDFIHIADVVDVLTRLTQNLPYQYKILNLTGGIKRSVEDLIDVINGSLASKVPVKYEGSTSGDQRGVCAQNDKIKLLLDWEPNVNFEDGISDMVNWYKNNK